MKKPAPPKLKKFPAGKQRRLDELLEKNSEGKLTGGEKSELERLVTQAEQLMVANARLLATFSRKDAGNAPQSAVPLTVWVSPQQTAR